MTSTAFRLDVRSLMALCSALCLIGCGTGGGERGNAGGENLSGREAGTEIPDAVPRTDGLPLTPGVYVMVGTDCAAPPNAAIRVYTGRGLQGSATRECRMTIEGRQRNMFSVAQSCIDTYSGERTTARQTLTLLDAGRFRLREEGEDHSPLYRLCPVDQLPDSLRTRLP